MDTFLIIGVTLVLAFLRIGFPILLLVLLGTYLERRSNLEGEV